MMTCRGRLASLEAARAVIAAGFPAPARRMYSGGDPADALAHEIREREAIRWNRRGEYEREEVEDDMVGAWSAFLRNLETEDVCHE